MLNELGVWPETIQQPRGMSGGGENWWSGLREATASVGVRAGSVRESSRILISAVYFLIFLPLCGQFLWDGFSVIFLVHELWQ